MQTWGEFLEPYLTADLLEAAFLLRVANEPWSPNEEDRKAAARLHMQLESRIATQPLGYLDGVEKSALSSVFALFDLTRKISEDHPLAGHFQALAWQVLNGRVRPFTAKWHRESERGTLRALDTTDEFRAELAALQPQLQIFSDLMLHLRDGKVPPERPPAMPGDREIALDREMAAPCDWGIPSRLGGIPEREAAALNASEKAAIFGRRAHYDLPQHSHAAALSGGGIRSATFSLGVLVALSRRGLLPQFDYLSTVSGGGYTGAFLGLFEYPGAHYGIDGLRADELPFRRTEGEAAALRHIRHHGKYLASGSVWVRLKMIGAQLYGMFLNSLGIVFLGALLVLIERFLRSFRLIDFIWEVAIWEVTALLLMMVLVAPRLLRGGARRQSFSDTALTLLGLALAALLIWRGLGHIHDYLGAAGGRRFSLGLPDWLIFLGTVPVLASALPALVGRLFKRTKIVLVILAAIAGPLFFFGIYLALYQWSFGRDISGMENLWILATATAILAAVYFGFLDINFTSPHRLYRNKLAEAFVIQPQPDGHTGYPFQKGVSLPLSHIGKTNPRGPYPLINGALNVPGSKDPAMQGRQTDFFLFSPAFCGSPLTGYRPSAEWEALDPHLDLATAMAISGAAAAPQMGLGTRRNLSFWLVLLNIRLGYWLRDPAKPHKHASSSPGMIYLLKEMFGTIDERSPFLNVSDGGHIENLGVYELLRRRCKFIVAIDGEQDERMTFAALTTLQRLASIDLGVKIDIDLDDLRLDEKGLSRSHFRFCRIAYPDGAHGYLLYVKLSLTGNEGEFLRRYRLDEPVFPHHSTHDQFFSETQFEAYRSLGEHVGDKLFLRALVGEEMAHSSQIHVEDWFGELGKRLLDPLPDRSV